MSQFGEPWTQENGVIETSYDDRIPPYGTDGMDVNDAKRICACVNFCRQFPTEFLEKRQLSTEVFGITHPEYAALKSTPGYYSCYVVRDDQ